MAVVTNNAKGEVITDAKDDASKDDKKGGSR